MENSKIVWALLDNRTGHRNQILGILSKLNFKYKAIEIKYNFLAFLPNFFFQIFNNNFHVNSIKYLIKEPYPDIIISCGRRTATIALALKKKFKFRPFCIHLMYPRFTLFRKNFNLIFTPNHDSVKKSKFVRKFLGSPSNIELKKIKNHDYVKPVFFLLIGGDHGRYQLSRNEVKELIYKISSKLNKKATILISTSRRTSKEIIEEVDKIKNTLKIIKEVFHPNKSSCENPYLKFLSIADEIIATGDSMSMLSDACETNKPVRIYYNDSFCSKKNISFCENLIKGKYAFSFETLGKRCTILKTLRTSEKIALEIKRSLQNGKN